MTASKNKAASAPQVFSFGDPEAVLDRKDVWAMFHVTHNGRWYEPPVPMEALGKTLNMAASHQSAIEFKHNLLMASFVPTRWLSIEEFEGWSLDWLLFGNAYLERVDNLAGRPLELRRLPAAWTRVGMEPGVYWWTQGSWFASEAFAFPKGKVLHLKKPDPLQEIYGLPGYLAALQSGLLNEAATIFRRRYYVNGAHAGFLMTITDPTLSEPDAEALRDALKGTKGVGQFSNLFLHLPGGTKDGVQIKHFSEVAAKDEFLSIKDVTRDDILAAHRVPPQLIGVIPKNTGGFGNVVDAARTFVVLEIHPILQRLRAINARLGLEAVQFDEVKLLEALARVAPTGNSSPAK